MEPIPELPVDDGWYWISDDVNDDPEGEDDWHPAYLTRGDGTRLYSFDPIILMAMPDARYRGVTVWTFVGSNKVHQWEDRETGSFHGSWRGPARWKSMPSPFCQ